MKIDEIIIPEIAEVVTNPGLYGWYIWVDKSLRVENARIIIKKSTDVLDPHGSVGIRFELVKDCPSGQCDMK